MKDEVNILHNAKVIPLSYVNSSKLETLEPGRYVIANMKQSRIVRVIEVLPQPEDLELEYVIVAKDNQ